MQRNRGSWRRIECFSRPRGSGEETHGRQNKVGGGRPEKGAGKLKETEHSTGNANGHEGNNQNSLRRLHYRAEVGKGDSNQGSEGSRRDCLLLLLKKAVELS